MHVGPFFIQIDIACRNQTIKSFIACHSALNSPPVVFILVCPRTQVLTEIYSKYGWYPRPPSYVSNTGSLAFILVDLSIKPYTTIFDFHGSNYYAGRKSDLARGKPTTIRQSLRGIPTYYGRGFRH